MQTLIDHFLKTYQARLKPSTLADYRSILRRHLSHFKDLENLNKGLEDYLAPLEISGKRKNNILSAARTLMGWARRRQIWEGSPLVIPRFPHRGRKIRPLDPEEARLVMNLSPPPYRDFFRVSILTGLRTGEALALQFADFDLQKKLVRISRTFSGGLLAPTKTMAGERDLPLLRPVWEIYERRRKMNLAGSPWFFYSLRGGMMSLAAIRRTWKDVLRAFEIEARPLYATRHTYASLAIAAGEDPLWVAMTLGHRRPDQLFLKYASYLEGVKRDGEKFLDLLGVQTLMRAIT
jgi:integrase